ncbi:hypothetical protein TNCV_232111, partial [Trichonephila clavipes]
MTEWPNAVGFDVCYPAALKGVALKDQCLDLFFGISLSMISLSKLNNLACCEIITFADDILVCSQ